MPPRRAAIAPVRDADQSAGVRDPRAGWTVLGLDPGSRRTGYGLVREVSGQLTLVDAGVINLPAAKDLCVRLGLIHQALAEIIAAHSPDEAAVENVFVSNNTMTALKLGQARGAALAACAVYGLAVNSYEPTRVKKSITGVGRADKDQVAFMVARVLNDRRPLAEDASDAVAVAVCHLNERKLARLARLA